MVRLDADIKSRVSSIENALEAINLKDKNSIDQFVCNFNRFYALNREYFSKFITSYAMYFMIRSKHPV